MRTALAVLASGYLDRVGRCIGIVARDRALAFGSGGVTKFRAAAEFRASRNLAWRARAECAGFGGVGEIRLRSSCRFWLPVGTISETMRVARMRRPSDGSRVQLSHAHSTVGLLI